MNPSSPMPSPSVLPRMPYVVLDMHLTRRAAAVEPLIAEFRASGQRVLLPWRQFYEMAKSDDAATTFIASVELFLGEPGVLAVARPSFVLASDEKDYKIRHTQPATIIDARDTANVHELMATVRDARGDYVDRIGAFLKLVRERAEGILAMEDDPTTLRKLSAWWKDGVDKKRVNEIRAELLGGERASFRAALLELATLENLREVLKGVGYGHKRAALACRYPSVSALKAIVFFALALHWRVMLGIETQSPAKLTNEGSDLEFCLLALYGTSYLTEEKKWVAIFGDCRAIAEHLWGASVASV